MCSAVLISRDSANGGPPPPPHLGSYNRALLVSQDKRNLFVTPWGCCIKCCVKYSFRYFRNSMRYCNTGTFSTPANCESFHYLQVPLMKLYLCRRESNLSRRTWADPPPAPSTCSRTLSWHSQRSSRFARQCWNIIRTIYWQCVLATPLSLSLILFFWDMSGFEPRELPVASRRATTL